MKYYNPIRAEYELGYLHGEETFYCASHRGIDIIVPVGTAVHADQSGKIVIGESVNEGKWLYIDRDGGGYSYMCHLSRWLKKAGDVVSPGDVIAESGNTGKITTGAHLHWSIYEDYLFVDPQPFLDSCFNNKIMSAINKFREELKSYGAFGVNEVDTGKLWIVYDRGGDSFRRQWKKNGGKANDEFFLTAPRTLWHTSKELKDIPEKKPHVEES